MYTDIGGKHCERYSFCICPLSVHGHLRQTVWAVLFQYLLIGFTRTMVINSVDDTVSFYADGLNMDSYCDKHTV